MACLQCRQMEEVPAAREPLGLPGLALAAVPPGEKRPSQAQGNRVGGELGH